MRSTVFALAILAVRPLSAGTLVGTISVEGPVTPLPPLNITVDKEVCGTGSIPNPQLVVSEDRKLANAVVLIDGPLPGEWSAAELTLDQRKCRFEPHVVVVPAGRKLHVVNSDGILHNFHTFSKGNAASNVAQPAALKVLDRTWEKPEAFRAECDVHSWMSAFIVVAESPYHAVTGLDGTYAIEGVPEGKHKVVVIHERLGRVEREVEIKGDKPVVLDVALDASPV